MLFLYIYLSTINCIWLYNRVCWANWAMFAKVSVSQGKPLEEANTIQKLLLQCAAQNILTSSNVHAHITY